ncbi:MAG: hypothetical protein M3130_01045 [Actinomycetota bacterium]|nr:hypothetical protein [Actinomycetota bacterium]
MSDEMWVVRAGERAKYAREFEASSYVTRMVVDHGAPQRRRTIKGGLVPLLLTHR